MCAANSDIMPNMRQITDKQREIYNYIVKQVERLGYQPSVRDIGSRFGIFPATVQGHIVALRKKGYLEAAGYNKKRANAITGDVFP